MENDNKYVLAMYDVRAKQNYIYKTKKLKEIQGASWIIRDCFKDHLFPVANEYRNEKNDIKDEPAIYNYKKDDDKPDNNNNDEVESFSFDEFEKRMEGDQYIGEVVYDGGGNFLILYKDKETCIEVSYRFGRRLLVEAPGLNVLCTYVENINLDNYNNGLDSGVKGDSQKLYDKHRVNENQESTVTPYGTLPIIQAEYRSSMPYTKKVNKVQSQKPEKVTAEAYAKYNKFYEIYKPDPDSDKRKASDEKLLEIDENVLDDLVTEKGKESLLAIIYIDGNNMGAKVQNLLKEKQDYDSCVTELRKFSEYINKKCVTERTDEIDKILTDKIIEDENKKRRKPLTEEEKRDISTQIRSRRLVVVAGDEINVICNARYAYDIAGHYLKEIYESSVRDEYGPVTSCAGIAIFHSHTPFADAYRIAEECCESGKKKMKELQLSEACFLDFHYCQGAIGISLEKMRETDEAQDFSLPWFMESVDEDHKGLCNKKDIEEVQRDLNKIGRSNVKGLAQKAKEGLLSLEMEIKRILAHTNETDFKVLNKFVDGEDTAQKEKYRKLIYDMVIVYDLWFADKGSEVKENE